MYQPFAGRFLDDEPFALEPFPTENPELYASSPEVDPEYGYSWETETNDRPRSSVYSSPPGAGDSILCRYMRQTPLDEGAGPDSALDMRSNGVDYANLYRYVFNAPTNGVDPSGCSDSKDGTEPAEPGATKISGPGRLPLKGSSVFFLSDNTSGDDSLAVWWYGLGCGPQYEKISGFKQVEDILSEFPDNSLNAIYFSGHGSGVSLVSTKQGGGLNIVEKKQEAFANFRSLLKRKLKPNGEVVLLGCTQGARVKQFSEILGVTVVGNTGCSSSCNHGAGDWMRYSPP